MTKKQLMREPTVGLEVHVELLTSSKMFCGCPANHFGVTPNTHTCPVCLGLPGSLPVPNQRAVEWTLLAGLALNCNINLESKFDRKHYFYPDLPKGFQISQYDEPLCQAGFLETSSGKVGITEVHLEEDTGKLLHRKLKGKDVTLVDFNRSGVPLMEIVSEPDIHSGLQAKEFAQKIRNILRYLEISDCDMEKGSMRLEANVSWGKELGYKVEVKNLNSFRFVEQAIDYELTRQKKILEKGGVPRQETRGWAEYDKKTKTQRYKETAADYRYFPEPDIPPMKFSKSYIDQLKDQIPELPDKKAKRFQTSYKLKQNYVEILTSSKALAEYAERSIKVGLNQGLSPEEISGAIINRRINIQSTKPTQLIDILKKQKTERISNSAKLTPLVEQAINDMPQAVEDYKRGKKAAISALIGKVMQLSKGRADASLTKSLLEKRLI